MRPLRQYLGAGRIFDFSRGRRVIAMRVSNEDMRNGFVTHCIQQRRDMRDIVGAGIDNRHLAAPDDVADCTFERERAWIIGHDRAHAGRHFLDLIGLEAETLVERNIVVHVGGGPSIFIYAATIRSRSDRRELRPARTETAPLIR